MVHIEGVGAICSLPLSGGSNVIIQAFMPEDAMTAIQNWRVTDVLLVPTMIQMLVDNLAGSFDLSSLKNVLYGGSPISEALLDRATAAFPRVRFTQDSLVSQR
jgi:long-chain acyl-CoA synthetase